MNFERLKALSLTTALGVLRCELCEDSSAIFKEGYHLDYITAAAADN